MQIGPMIATIALALVGAGLLGAIGWAILRAVRGGPAPRIGAGDREDDDLDSVGKGGGSGD